MYHPFGRAAAGSLVAGILSLAFLMGVPFTLNSCTSTESVVREAASIGEAQAMAADTGGLIVVDFWVSG